MKIIHLILISLYLASASANNFLNVICGKEIADQFPNFEEVTDTLCIFKGINSTKEFENIFLRINNGYQFAYDECKYIQYMQRCERKRNNWNTYNGIIFYDSHLENLTIINDYNQLSYTKSLIASKVGLNQINRDDFKPFKSLLKLDLSQNNLTYLGNMVFRHLEVLTSLNLSMNKIQSIHIGSFDECSQTLNMIDLSFNNLKTFPANILDALTLKSLDLHLQHNEIETMTVPIVNKEIHLKNLDVSNNQLKEFKFFCDSIETLWLNDNQIKELSITPNCTISHLYLSNNQLEHLIVEKVSSLFLSQNIRLKKLTINDVSELIALEASDFNPNVITMSMLKNATMLINLELSGTFIGPLAFDTFADMTELRELKLRNTGITRIDYGMLSHQKNLELLDISHNNLGFIDLHVMTNLKYLINLDISGNNLTQLPNYESIRKIFPNLEIIGIDENDFNCTYLAMIIKSLNEMDILLKDPENPIKNSSNIYGIACTAESYTKVKLLENSSDAIAMKLNELIDEINNEKKKFESEKFNNDLIKSELFHIRNELIDLRTKALKSQMNFPPTANGSIDMSEMRKVIETVNNLTLEKQKLSNDQVLLKFNELHLEVARLKMENEKTAQKNVIVNAPQSSNNNHEDARLHSTSEILLTIVITSLVIAAMVFVYSKARDIFKQHQEYDYSVRARSTNTINTTVEMPFDDRHR